MDAYFVRRDARGTVICAACGDLERPASHVATYEKTDGSGRGAWALCEAHAPFGIIAFGNLVPLAEFIGAPNTTGKAPEAAREGDR